MAQTILPGQVELLFVKSKVYLHPSPSKRDNIPGFLALSRPPKATNLEIILSFTPESQLSSEDLKIYQQVDVEDIQLNLDSLNYKHGKASSSRIVSKPSQSLLLGYSFNSPLLYVYSIQFRKPSHGFWHGSIIINTQDGEKLPILFFHDNESALTLKNQKLQNQRFDPFGSDGELYWGGTDFLNALQGLVNVQRSTIEPSVYLINPESTDLRNFAPFKQKAETPKPDAEPFKLPDVGKFFATAKWKVLETVATFSAKTKNLVLDIIDDNAPSSVKELISKPEVARIGDEYDSARIYLAKWAQQVKEEAEKSQGKYMLDDQLYSRINRELGSSEMLTPEEISKTSRRGAISVQEWKSFFDISGRLMITADEVKNRIFHGGLHDDVRQEAWLFLLNVFPWDSSEEERETLRDSYATRYDELTMKWAAVDVEERPDVEFYKDQKFRIEKDIHRTDRNLDIFKNPVKKPLPSAQRDQSEPEPERESSPETPDEESYEDEGIVITNIHLQKMRNILLTYNEHNVNLGYVQGMTDLLSPLYVVIRDEPLVFFAFANFMERMERNFVRDQSGMKKQMNTLNKLLQFMLPNLYKHLEKCQSNDLFFFFRMLLVWFKREFEWADVLTLWEVLWTDCYSSQFILFFCLSVLSDNERIIIQNLRQFDEVLKYFNDLSGKLNLNLLLIRSEVLFLKFKRTITIIDRDDSLSALAREPYEGGSATTTSTVDTHDELKDLRELLRKDIIIQKEVERPEGVGGG
ncbi:GTPase-activating protein GYP7 [Candida viswanathii]|uniref:Oxidant-induced cell-cycle arrest protein 5 n=1 Tax=Candida viswanathii TaxID=5486 RepID=A0A367YL17_9ASCO|nr:GTPase-activating protein GYP7 [Candida viswanathii]